MKYFWTLCTYLYLIVGTAFFATLAGFSALLGDRRGRLWWPAAQSWARQLLWIGGVQKIHVQGLEKLRRGTLAIVMSNHQSHFDPPLLIATSEEPLRFLTKHSLFYFPIFGQSLWAMGFIFINRGVREKAFASIDRAARDIVKKRKTLLVFPEGTRARTGEMLPFKKGGFLMATKSHVPIIPVGIAGTREILPPGWVCTGRGPVVVIVGDPIDTSAYDESRKEELAQRVRAEIERLRERARAERLGHLAGAKGTAAAAEGPLPSHANSSDAVL